MKKIKNRILCGYLKHSFARAVFFLCCFSVLISCSDETVFATEQLPNSLSDDTDDSSTDTNPTFGTDSDTKQDTDTMTICDIPTRFQWTSSEPLILPQENNTAIKDPSVLFFNGRWYLFATYFGDGIGISYLTFSDWSEAGQTEQISNVQNENLLGYTAAPQLFYFSPQNRWYLIFQTQEPAYSTTENLDDFLSWGPITRLMPTPPILVENDALGFDYWIICDDTDCYMFFTGLNGMLYRARTSKSDFPNGFEGTTEVILQDEQFSLYDACSVYKLAGSDQYLLLVSALGETGRYLRSWTANSLSGTWTPLADTEENAFASMLNVTGADWVNSGIVQGEMLRYNPDETMTIDPCNLQYLYSADITDDDTESEYFGLALLTSVVK